MQETILILDFGSQYTQLIARRVRELNVYCEIHPYNAVPPITSSIKGVILSGSPFSVHDKDAPNPDLNIFNPELPILGVCYGAQLIVHQNNGKVLRSQIREYGRANIATVNNNCSLFKDIEPNTQVWMSHGDTITNTNDDFEITASTQHIPVAGYKIKNKPIYGIQFHPEVYHTTQGLVLLKNFVVDICKCNQKWTPASFIETTINHIKHTIGNDKVVMGVSGGVDSTVAAYLINKAIGKQLFCIFIDNGLLRKNEFEQVLADYKEMGLNVKGVDAKQRFWDKLKEVEDPEKKRKIIGNTFIDVFDEEAHQIIDANWLGQGTIYPDVIESKSVKGPSATIKSHHNVGGLPDFMKLKVIEPLNTLFKDEVRAVGRELQIPDNLLSRHPFPGPGLAIRILGDITPEKVQLLQEVDAIFIQGLKDSGLYSTVWQAAAILLPIRSVGVMGDERTYENVVCLRAVSSTDGMTADWVHLPYDFLASISNSIINKVKGVNRVVYDISSKPPATIEWE